MLCRICRSTSFLFYEDSRKYFACNECHHIFTQQNADTDQARQYFLSHVGLEDELWWKDTAKRIILIINVFHKPKRILNFGSGQGELSNHFKSMGYDVTSFEPIIHGSFNNQCFEYKFDTIIATEVIEHVINIHEEFHRLFSVLQKEGLLFFTTAISNPFETVDPQKEFSGFWYKDDPTHVNFFCQKSVETLANLYKCKNIFLADNKGFLLLPFQDEDSQL